MTRLFLSSFSAFLSDFLPLHLLTDLKRMLVVYYPAFNSTVRYVVWGMTFVLRVTENVDFVVHHHWSSSHLLSFSSHVYSHRTLLLLPHFWLSFFGSVMNSWLAWGCLPIVLACVAFLFFSFLAVDVAGDVSLQAKTKRQETVTSRWHAIITKLVIIFFFHWRHHLRTLIYFLFLCLITSSLEARVVAASEAAKNCNCKSMVSMVTLVDSVRFCSLHFYASGFGWWFACKRSAWLAVVLSIVNGLWSNLIR